MIIIKKLIAAENSEQLKPLNAMSEQKYNKLNQLQRDSKEAHLINSNRTIICPKGEFTFTKQQTPIIKIFWNNYNTGNEFLNEQDVLEMVEMSTSKLPQLFKSRKDAFKVIFEQHHIAKDLWRLKLD